MELIFHEAQVGSLCAQHCLNSLLQGDFYSAVDLANIANECDQIERRMMAEAGTASDEFVRFMSQESSNYDDSGFFSIQVLQRALKAWNLELVPYQSQHEVARFARLAPTEQRAYICNFKEHWYTIRRIGPYWFNLNSMLKRPELVSDTYLSVLLAQLQAEGYQIFIVNGDLPSCEAERVFAYRPLDFKKVLDEQNARRSQLGKSKTKSTSKKTQANVANHDDDEFDEEMERAIRMSLDDNESEQMNAAQCATMFASVAAPTTSSKRYSSAHTVSTSPPASSSSSASVSTVLTAEEIRRRRLEFLNTKK